MKDKEEQLYKLMEYACNNYDEFGTFKYTDSFILEEICNLIITSQDTEEEKCPFCESENLFDIWMHHYKCKDCNEKWDK